MFFVSVKPGLSQIALHSKFQDLLHFFLLFILTCQEIFPGSCIFLLDALQTEYPDVCKSAEASCSNLNVCCCFVTCKHQRIAIISVYRLPFTCLKAVINELTTVLLQLSTSVQHFILAGDFNINLFDGSNTQSEYMNLLSDFNLVQHVTEPTHVCSISRSATLIDHLIGSEVLNVALSIQAVGIRDHRVQIVDFDVTVCRRAPREIWVHSFKKCNWDQVRESLATAPWNVMSIYDDLDDQWSFFHSILMESFQFYAPFKRVYSKKSKRPTPWISDAILERIKLKNKVKCRAEKFGNPADKEVFRK